MNEYFLNRLYFFEQQKFNLSNLAFVFQERIRMLYFFSASFSYDQKLLVNVQNKIKIGRIELRVFIY